MPIIGSFVFVRDFFGWKTGQCRKNVCITLSINKYRIMYRRKRENNSFRTRNVGNYRMSRWVHFSLYLWRVRVGLALIRGRSGGPLIIIYLNIHNIPERCELIFMQMRPREKEAFCWPFKKNVCICTDKAELILNF